MPQAAAAVPISSQPQHQASSRLHHLMQLLPAGVLVLDESGVVVEANPQAVELLGEPLLGLRWRQIIQRAFAPQRDDGHEISLRNGRRVKLATRALDPEPGQLLMLTDLTETRQLQHNISHLERLSALGKMAASLAHQIRTPLSAALLYAANLSNRNLDDRGRDRFQHKLMARLGELEQRVNDLLLFARGGNEQQLQPVALATVAEQLQQHCDAQLSQRGASWLAPSAACGQINANLDTLVSAMGNLVINALEAGATALQLQIEPQGNFVQLRLLDNGSGMDEATQARILSPFYTTKTNGTGLGLAVVQSVCRSHGGRLEVSSVAGQGSCFTVIIPRWQTGANQ
ncbi:HAMP domain-containing sensor histidine kinase [uncultured Ferrimonas sp.]|uniref:sensor histidine kinase n=1 Tax=uncultured Ferrimonas sp. TaxID=432640 RepID=UPI0026271175|nr:HAMP domain-containing sensor histidine kinase [uncultured Ferrimonas sp.]